MYLLQKNIYKYIYVFKKIITAKNLSAVWQIYLRPLSSTRIFWTIKVATVRERSCPLFIILRHRGIISVCIKNVIASESSPIKFILFNFFLFYL